ncbi:MAG: hypothetical protein QOI03_2359 [Solirubrobacteraceae bacterium]|nr:hypothetical protein [Solirubrobacteraceae bacterium]
MSDPPSPHEPAYHLFLEPQEVPLTASALRLLISDEAHEPAIRGLARDVLEELRGDPNDRGVLTVALEPKQMKITHSAVRLLLNDTRRDQASDREILHEILEKLPDEHSLRAIELE